MSAGAEFEGNYGMWVIRGYDNVVRAVKDTATYSSRDTWPGARPLCPAAGAVAVDAQPIPATLLSSDPPRQSQYRRIVQRAFSSSRVAGMRPHIEDIVDSLLAAVRPQDEIEFVASFASPLPIRVIAEMLGVPDDLYDRFKQWGDHLALSLSADITDEEQVLTTRTLIDFQQYFMAAIAERRRQPTDDFLSDLSRGPGVDGPEFTVPELLSFCQQLVVAGQETTTSLLGGMAVILAERPDLQRELRDHPNLHSDFIEESLRYWTPVQGRYRVTTAPVIVGDAELPAGVKVQLHFGDANHDADVYDEPEQFRLGRTASQRHIAFGLGPHFCLGAPLARLEAEVALQALLAATSDIALGTSPPRRRKHFHLRGFDSVHLALQWR
ncbi:MAG: hypothetical protein JWQ19_3980 [Subtercola sp.]|nr:hypothetical protein [Subtercola sp.]